MTQTTAQYITYFKALSEKHIVLKHNDETNRVFAFISQEEAIGDYRTGASSEGVIFRLVVPQFSLADNEDGYSQAAWLGGFIIAKKHSVREDASTEIGNILGTIDIIGVQIAAKMVKDCNEGHPLFAYSVRTLQQIKFKALPKPLLTEGYIGRLFTFNFSNPISLCSAEIADCWQI